MKFEILQNRAILEVMGADCTKFLQGILTKNIEKLENDLTYCLWLNPQGKYLYEIFLYKIHNGFLIDVHAPHKDNLLNKIKIYKLRAQINVTDVSDGYHIVYSNIRLANALQSHRDPRNANLGYRSVLDRENLSKLEFNLTTKNLYIEQKYELAIPDHNDLIQDKSFPLEFGLHYLNAIDSNKGCYIGQEPISRTIHRGVVRKNIYKLEMDSNFESLLSYDTQATDLDSNDLDSGGGAWPVMVGATKIGFLTSYYNNIAIAIIRDEYYEEALREHGDFTVSSKKVTIHKPKWRP